MPLQRTYRPRPINWNLLVNPSMQALAIREAGSRDMNQSIMAGLVDVGRGITRARAEKESARRFDVEAGLAEDRLDLLDSKHEFEKKKYEEDRLDEQAADQALLEALEQTGTRAVQELNVHGDLTPQTAASLKQNVDSLGGPQATVQKVASAQQQAPMSFEEYAAKHCPT